MLRSDHTTYTETTATTTKGMVEVEQQNKPARVFVGGLGAAVTAEDLRRLFGSLGSVEAVEIIRTKGRSFAYVDFLPSPTDEKSLSKLFSKYNGCLWKGGKLKLEKAKEHYLSRLKREWDEEAAAVAEELVSSQPVAVEEKPAYTKESLKAKQLHIFFPRLRKVKSIPFIGTGKHKYSFQNIKVGPLPVHFCDCEEQCSPPGTERGKLYANGATESGGINDEEINIMNAVMIKLLEKENVSDEQHLEKQDECEVDSATDEDDIIINIDAKKNKSALIGSQKLERILGNQESLQGKTRIAKEEPIKSERDGHKRPNKKRKLLLTKERKGSMSATAGGKSNMEILPDEPGSDAQTTESEGDFGESTKVSWTQKSSWKELLGDGSNTAFNASLILPMMDSGKEKRRSKSQCTPLPANSKTENMEMDESLWNNPTNTEMIKENVVAHTANRQLIEEEHAEVHPANNTQVVEEGHAEAYGPTHTQVIEESAEAQPSDKNVASNKTGRGSFWRQKQSWTQLVGTGNSSFSISQILPGITFSEPTTKEPILDPSLKCNVVAKDTVNQVDSDGFNLGKIVMEKNQNVGAKNSTRAAIVQKEIETRPMEKSSEEIMPKERFSADAEIGETCTFMRSSASLKDWAKAKAAMSGSLKRKRGEC